MQVFLDCGGHRGQSIKHFRKSFPEAKSFTIHTFEPNSELWGRLEKSKVKLHKIAVWIYDGETDFYLAESRAGSTIVKGKLTAHVDYEHPIKVPCIDLSKWIKENFKQEDIIYLKLNIEGAEYEILRKMLADGTIKYLNRLFVNFHHKKITSITKKESEELKQEIEKIIHIEPW